MRLLASLIRLAATISQAISIFFNRVSRFLDGLLPALLPASQLNALTREYYDDRYSQGSIRGTLKPEDHELERWEAQVFNRYNLNCGRILVLGSGQGRESAALAKRGVTVVGVDTSGVAVRTAHRYAKVSGIPAHFCQSSFLELPFTSGSFDFVLLTNVMYSAIPDASARQTWLSGLQQVLKPDGLVILSFVTERHATPRLKPLCTRLNSALVKLPGASKTYLPGDAYAYGHFIHFFQEENEIRNELLGAQTMIQELNWTDGFAVVTYSPSIDPSS